MINLFLFFDKEGDWSRKIWKPADFLPRWTRSKEREKERIGKGERFLAPRSWFSTFRIGVQRRRIFSQPFESSILPIERATLYASRNRVNQVIGWRVVAENRATGELPVDFTRTPWNSPFGHPFQYASISRNKLINSKSWRKEIHLQRWKVEFSST